MPTTATTGNQGEATKATMAFDTATAANQGRAKPTTNKSRSHKLEQTSLSSKPVGTLNHLTTWAGRI